MNHPKTIEEATAVIAEYPEADFFIDKYYSQYFLAGEGMGDNGIELQWYWQECKKMVELNSIVKEGDKTEEE